jgi:DNA-binding phage protein
MTTRGHTYKSYSFLDKDPEIDRLRGEIARQKIAYAILVDESGVSLATLVGWFNGKTRRPQHATVMAVWAALGYSLAPRPLRGTRSVRLVHGASFKRNI